MAGKEITVIENGQKVTKLVPVEAARARHAPQKSNSDLPFSVVGYVYF